MKYILIILNILALAECYVVWQMADSKLIPQEAFWLIAGLLMLGVIVVSVMLIVSVAEFFQEKSNE